MIPPDLKAAVLRHPGQVLRGDVAAAQAHLDGLQIAADSVFREFFIEFQGPFPYGNGDMELLDIARPTPSIPRATMFVQDCWGVPSDFVCLVSPEGEGCVLYDRKTECVYDTGLDEIDRLCAGTLTPRWSSFVEYLRDYFSVIREPAEPL